MENFVYEYPTKVYFGKGAAKAHLPGILSACGPNVLLAYGGGSIKKNGVYEEITGILKETGKSITEFTGIMSNPTWAKVKEGAGLARENKVDLVLAVGGGSVIDCCKIVCAQAVTDEDLWELEMVQHKAPSAAPMSSKAVASAAVIHLAPPKGTPHEHPHRLLPPLRAELLPCHARCPLRTLRPRGHSVPGH